MNSVVGFWGELKDLVQSIQKDCAKNKGMWLAYAFIFAGLILAAVVCVLLFMASFKLLAALNEASADFSSDNPLPLAVWGAILYATYAIIANLHEVYLEIRQVIRKGNR